MQIVASPHCNVTPIDMPGQMGSGLVTKASWALASCNNLCTWLLHFTRVHRILCTVECTCLTIGKLVLLILLHSEITKLTRNSFTLASVTGRLLRLFPCKFNRTHWTHTICTRQMDISVGGSLLNSVRNFLFTVNTPFDSWYASARTHTHTHTAFCVWYAIFHNYDVSAIGGKTWNLT